MVTPPFDPTRALGVVWCVTVTGLPLREALRRVGVSDFTERPDGTELASRRLAEAAAIRERAVLVLARRVEPGRTLLLELESVLGWRGGDPEVLTDLATIATGMACSVVKDPNRTSVLFAEKGEKVRAVASLDAVTGLLHGNPGLHVSTALSTAGLTDLSGAAGSWTPSQRASHALQVAAGVRLDPDMWGGSWTGGLSAGFMGA
ncbi:hypothetical protein ACIRF8_31530 [Streptomyces sp. NPDC102406]|uniref:hypothetical protein n=1 Tax=Streptomyces sp. NPDC102406 TaxID=3366171 RepID=UPI003802992B